MTKQLKNILIIGAHPDDCEIHVGGMAIRWAQAGHRVSMVSYTDGQSGHLTTTGEALATLRREEAMQAAAPFGIESVVGTVKDGHMEPSLENRLDLIRMVREYKADLVITNRLNDYHPDHRYLAQCLQDAAFSYQVPNIAPEAPALGYNPCMLYWWDNFTQPTAFRPDVVCCVDDVFNEKMQMMMAHKSQFFEWLPYLAGKANDIPPTEPEKERWFIDDYWPTHKQASATNALRSELIKRYGEAGNTAKLVEAFEVSEYGGALTQELKDTLFHL